MRRGLRHRVAADSAVTGAGVAAVVAVEVVGAAAEAGVTAAVTETGMAAGIAGGSKSAQICRIFRDPTFKRGDVYHVPAFLFFRSPISSRDDLDFDFDIAGQATHLHGSSGRGRGREVAAIDLIHFGEVVHVGKK